MGMDSSCTPACGAILDTSKEEETMGADPESTGVVIPSGLGMPQDPPGKDGGFWENDIWATLLSLLPP